MLRAGQELFSELHQVDNFNLYILPFRRTIYTFSPSPLPPRAPLSLFHSWLLLWLAFGQTSNRNLCISLWVYFLLEKTHSYKNHDSLTSWGQLPDQYQSEWEAHDGCPFGLKEKQQRHIKLSQSHLAHHQKILKQGNLTFKKIKRLSASPWYEERSQTG